MDRMGEFLCGLGWAKGWVLKQALQHEKRRLSVQLRFPGEFRRGSTPYFHSLSAFLEPYIGGTIFPIGVVGRSLAKLEI